MWVYGSGFPKSHSIPAAIDRIKLGKGPRGHAIATAGTIQVSTGKPLPPGESLPPYSPESSEAKHWQGWGTALKPAHEPICVARKPLSEKNVASNVLKWGTGGIDIDESRIEATQGEYDIRHYTKEDCFQNLTPKKSKFQVKPQPQGRWPSNIILECTCDEVREGEVKAITGGTGKASKKSGGRHNWKPSNTGSKGDANGKEKTIIHTDPNCPCYMLDEQSGDNKGAHGGTSCGYDWFSGGNAHQPINKDDSGGASRFFYIAKASPKERGRNNAHPTVKPVALMEYLVKMVSREGYTVLDPFAGSMTTLLACASTGRKCIAIEQSEEYCKAIKNRFRQVVLI